MAMRRGKEVDMFNLYSWLLPIRLLVVMLIVFSATCGSAAEVDPALIGTWQLQWPGEPIYWDIRADGTYEVSGSGAAVAHAGTFAAAAGKWSLSSSTWGEDGGTYRPLNENRLMVVGKLGPGTWMRAPNRAVEKAADEAVQMAVEPDGSRLLPKDVPELMHAATQRARLWRKDAIPVMLEFEHQDIRNYKGPEVRFSFYSPSEGTGFSLTVKTNSVRTHVFDQAVRWGEASLPPVFVDLPSAVRIARNKGMKGPLKRANLRIWSPGDAPPVLAWMMSTGASTGGGRTVDGASGQIIDYDVTGYIAAYNAQWERAARGLRALFQSARGGSSRDDGSPFGRGSSSSSSSTSSEPHDENAWKKDYQRSVAEDRAYWGGNSNDYNRIKNGECSWSDSSNYGC